ncbi:hypothetical protein Tco_1082449 [Tanacetum coccineum]|uniref:Uncharacterized protein n=1 Tax=Tanacetum coccineum TaxID=301880 RepID=A0ABQ5I1A2_9ASTR
MWINAKLLWKEFISLHHPLIIDSESKNIQDHCQSLLELSLPDISRRARDQYGYTKNHMKTIINTQARTRESEEYKKKPKNLSLSQKQSKDGQTKSTQKDKSSKYFTLVPQLSQKSKNVPSSLIGPRKAYWA